MPALALTDHLSLTGTLAFYNACKSNGVQPILGLEIDLLLPYRLSAAPAPVTTGSLVLLAMDRTGWQNICRLSSQLRSNPEQFPYSTLEQLAAFSESLICLTGGCRGAVQHLLDNPSGEHDTLHLLGQLSDIFPQRLYIELNQQPPADSVANARLAGIAEQLSLPLVAAQNIYYADPDQAALQRTLAAMRVIQPLSALSAAQCAPPAAHFTSTETMQRQFAAIPKALAATLEIAQRCNFTLPLGETHYPQPPLPAGLSALDLLRQKSADGARQLYGNKLPVEVARRLESELAIIAERGYEPIFLIAEEMLAFARQQGIPSASRGSASSSLVAHCIGITTPDPLKLDLYFERFLNPARATPPDIDTDFCSRQRDNVIQHLFDTYGSERVAMVGTVNTFRPRSALSEVAKAHGLKPAEVRTLTGGLFHRYWSYRTEDEAGQPERSPYAELMAQHGENPRYRSLFAQAEALLGLPHHLSVHAGGVVIAPGPIVDYVPVARSGGKGVTITQFDLDDVEQIGLVKLDLLGIRGLTVLGDVAGSIHSWRRREFKSIIHVLDRVPADDPETAAMIAEGRTIGCFQIKSPGMRATLKEIHASSIPDLMAALALYRPGPLKGGLRDAFVRRHNRQEAVEHIHPALSNLLKETYGVILYQEQVLRIAHELAGLSLAEADLLRRAMSHFDPGKQMQLLKERFIGGSSSLSDVPGDVSERIWEMMMAFAGYGFPKAHAASYAEVAWRSAWCKTHYPAEFIAAVLANWGGYYPQSVYLNEARRLGFAVRPPHVNHARQQFSVSYPNGNAVLYMGLDQVRALTHRTQERIQRFRPFHSLTEFMLKVDPRQQEVQNLIQVGAFEDLGTIPDLLQELSTGLPRLGQLSLFGSDFQTQEDWSLEQKVAAQQRLLGISLEAHPLEMLATEIREANAINTIEAAARPGETIRVAGMRQTLHRSLTAAKDWMAFLTLEDLEGMLDVVLFPEVYRRVKNLLNSSAAPLIIEGEMDRDTSSGEPVLVAENVWRLA